MVDEDLRSVTPRSNRSPACKHLLAVAPPFGLMHLACTPRTRGRVDAKSTFVKRFGDLVTLFRLDPGNDAAQELALAAAAAAVADRSIEVEAGVEWSALPPEMGLKARMLARQIDCLRITAGALSQELESLARALAHDVTPVRSSPSIEVEFVRLLAPPGSTDDGGRPDGPPSGGGRPGTSSVRPVENRRRSLERREWDDRRQSARLHWNDVDRRRAPERRVSGERRLFLVKDLRAESTRLLQALGQATRSHAWDEVLHTAWALFRLAPRMPLAERRTFTILVRRALPRPVLESLVDLAERDYVARDRAALVLRTVGLDAVDVMLDRLRRGEALGVRVFFYQVVGGVPEAYRLVTPMLRSPRSHEVRHGAILLGRLGIPGAVEDLAPLIDHPDEVVRAAVLQALGELHDGPVSEPLRRGLHHRSARTRAAAADAAVVWRGGVLAVLIAAALEAEHDHDAWQSMVSALGRIGSAEACAALATVALTRRGLLRRRGYTTGQRLAAVAALGYAETGHGHATLERLARESEGVVSYAADRVLRAEGLRAG